MTYHLVVQDVFLHTFFVGRNFVVFKFGDFAVHLRVEEEMKMFFRSTTNWLSYILWEYDWQLEKSATTAIYVIE